MFMLHSHTLQVELIRHTVLLLIPVALTISFCVMPRRDILSISFFCDSGM